MRYTVDCRVGSTSLVEVVECWRETIFTVSGSCDQLLYALCDPYVARQHVSRSTD